MWVFVFSLGIFLVFLPFAVVIATGNIYGLLLVAPLLALAYLEDRKNRKDMGE